LVACQWDAVARGRHGGPAISRNRDKTSKIPVAAVSQTELLRDHGKYFNAKCCWDYGNMEAQVKSDGVVIAAVTSDATDNLIQAKITSVHGK